jgi:hypothetical protein
MKQCVNDFLEAASGGLKKNITLETETVSVGGSSSLLCFIGHNGLMDFSLENFPVKKTSDKRETIILACISKSYFAEPIQSAGASPLLWTTGLMAPEAYTLEGAISGWLNNETGEQIRTRAAEAYDRYQKCGIKGARNLLVTGF